MYPNRTPILLLTSAAHRPALARLPLRALRASARPVGKLRTPDGAGLLTVLSAQSNGEAFEITARPLTDRRQMIVSVNRADLRPDEEVQISAAYTVTMKRAGPPIPVNQPAHLAALPNVAGIYFIYVNQHLWYLGKALDIRSRFTDRFRVFHEFNIPPSAYSPLLAKVEVGWRELKFSGSSVARGMKSGPNKKGPFRPILGKTQGLLRVIEQYYLHINPDTKNPPGNKAPPEPLTFLPGGSLTIREEPGGPPVTLR
jgi:hypothetical protein